MAPSIRRLPFLVVVLRVSPPAEARRVALAQRIPTAALHHLYDTSNYGRLQLNNGLALTPQMGWNSWNFFACNINETVIRETEKDGPVELDHAATFDLDLLPTSEDRGELAITHVRQLLDVVACMFVFGTRKPSKN